ncbi:MAG: hypothetical protein FJ296_08370 [Planctomycetes bacterium]|nr:hypothetical protein [Planctomycetota bacterium]
MRPSFAAGLPALLLAACVTVPAEPPAGGDTAPTEARTPAEIARDDFLQRLAEAMRRPDPDDADTLLNSLEHLLPAWLAEQRRGQAAPLENILTIKVVTRFDDVLAAFRTGQRERRLVAAWALGFSRVPDNDLGLVSRHVEARDALVAALSEPDDDLLRNVLLGLWKLGDPATPLRPLLDLLVQHHDPEVRANAALAVGGVLRPATFAGAADALLVALGDREPRVRVHAAMLARRFPSAAGTKRLLQLLPAEDTPLARAAMASALGAARASEAGPLLVDMLSSAIEVEAVAARQALAEIYGTDAGPRAADWQAVIGG